MVLDVTSSEAERTIGLGIHGDRGELPLALLESVLGRHNNTLYLQL